jgi:hypothetical protein
LPRKSPTDAIEDGSLHAGRLDLVVYIPVDGGFLVVTRNLRVEGWGDPLRVVMGLADRDSVAFSALGHQDSLYRAYCERCPVKVRRGDHRSANLPGGPARMSVMEGTGPCKPRSEKDNLPR